MALRQVSGTVLIALVQIFVWLFYAYLGVGVLLLAWWWTRGLRRLDAAAANGSQGFKLLISPGLVALWPLLLGKARRGDGHPVAERNAHRDAARGEGASP